MLVSVARKDWKSIESTMNRFGDWLWLPLKTHAAAMLHQYDRPRLEDLVDRTDDFFEVAAYVLHAPMAQTLTLALTNMRPTPA
ncbi:hypothetical protein CTTA_4577 [Comamonas testosteroni]|uniref:Uncharacterized protein n=1 Tax=Comamonas testosteroni TaxID=285 RepID=A0A5A7MIQ8_COMTE|nr:hypothetical protein [Comamonas testosteroni]GEQ77572.1 hypothetical protein CTTA_4577 [Comamonas testosteroni]